MGDVMAEYHAEEERLMNHLKYKHGLEFKEYAKEISNHSTYDAVEDLWKFHDNLHKQKE